MTRSQTNRPQMLRLAQDVAFPPDVPEVTVLHDGSHRIDSVWDNVFASPGIDLGDREQPVTKTREHV